MTRARHRVLFARRTSSDIITCKYRRYFRPAIDFRSSIQARLVPGTDVYVRTRRLLSTANSRRSIAVHTSEYRPIDRLRITRYDSSRSARLRVHVHVLLRIPPPLSRQMIELRARACPPTWKPRTSRGFFPPTSWTRFVFRFWCIVFQIAERTIERRFKVYQNKKCSTKNSYERTRNLR